MMAEKNILAALRFPFIVQFYGSLQDDRHLYLVLQYVIGGEFFTHLRSANRFPNDTARFYAAAVVLAFEHLHDQNIIFRDLKPENLLLDNLGYVKVTDFGFAKRIDALRHTRVPCTGDHSEQGPRQGCRLVGMRCAYVRDARWLPAVLFRGPHGAVPEHPVRQGRLS